MKKDHQKNKKNADNRKAIEINSLLHKVNVGVNSDNVFVFSSPLTVADFAKSINHSSSEIIRYFLIKGQMLNINSLLTEEQIGELCLNFGLDFKKEDEVTEENIFDHIKVNPQGAKYRRQGQCLPRPPRASRAARRRRGPSSPSSRLPSPRRP